MALYEWHKKKERKNIYLLHICVCGIFIMFQSTYFNFSDILFNFITFALIQNKIFLLFLLSLPKRFVTSHFVIDEYTKFDNHFKVGLKISNLWVVSFSWALESTNVQNYEIEGLTKDTSFESSDGQLKGNLISQK